MVSKSKTSNKQAVGSGVSKGLFEGVQNVNHLYQFISIIIMLRFSGGFLPDIINASSELGSTGIPLSSLFNTGIIVMIIVAIIIVTVIRKANVVNKP